MAEFKSTISSQNFDKALQGGLDYAADKSGIQEALKELSAKGFVYIGPDQPTDGTMYWLDTSEEEPDVPVVPDEPDVPVTLIGISAVYSGGEVDVGTPLSDLTGIVVTATYSDGSTATVTGYTLSGTIAEGSNTITVTYEGKTATFTVTGVAEEEPSGPKVYSIPAVAMEYKEGYVVGTAEQYNAHSAESCYKVAGVKTGDVLVCVQKNTVNFGIGKVGEAAAVQLTGTKDFHDNYSWCTVTWTADKDYDFVWINVNTELAKAHTDALTWTTTR